MRKRLPTSMVIRNLRHEKKMTLQELADKAGISVQYISTIEKGYSAISDEVKKRIADALDYSVWTLFPEVKMNVGPLDPFEVLRSRFDEELNIKPQEEPLFKEVLKRLTRDEFSELIGSGVQPADVRRKIRKWAAEFGIETD